MAKRLLYIAMHAWTSPIQVGSQAIAAQFVRNGWDVAYVSAPITLLNWLRPRASEYECRLREYRSGGQLAMEGRVWHYVPFALLSPNNRLLLRSSWLFEHWQHWTIPNVLSTVQQQGFGQVDLLMLDSIYQPFWLDVIAYKKSVFRIADHNAGFWGYGRGARASEDKIIQKSDCVVTASHAMQTLATARGAQQVMYLPNGVDFQRFNTGMPEKPIEYRALKGPIAVYVGVIAEWVDLTLIEACARARPDVQFVLIGPRVGRTPSLSHFYNIHFMGPRPATQIPAYLRHADVGLIPFRADRFTALIDHINPLKLYEYMAAGLPVVSTCWQELANLNSPAYRCESQASFVTGLSQALQPHHHTEHYRQFARTADWSTRTTALIEWASSV